MSLLTEAMEPCVMLDKVTTPDGYGGYYSRWVEGAGFNAAFTYDTSMQARIAGAQGITDLYTVTTSKRTNLQFHDVFQRVSDGTVFRVTTSGTDKKTPASASLDMRQVAAERWDLPNG